MPRNAVSSSTHHFDFYTSTNEDVQGRPSKRMRIQPRDSNESETFVVAQQDGTNILEVDASVPEVNITGALSVSGGISGTVTTDKIQEGNSSVEVVDTGSGQVVTTVDGNAVMTVDAGNVTATQPIVQSSANGYLVVNNTGAGSYGQRMQRSGANKWAVWSTAADDFNIYNYGVGRNDMVIDSNGNSDFAGSMNVKGILSMGDTVGGIMQLKDSSSGKVGVITMNSDQLRISGSAGVTSRISSDCTIDDLDATVFKLASTTVSSTAAELNLLDGVTATTAEFNLLDGVTSTTAEINQLVGIGGTTVSAQLATKLPLSGGTVTGDLTVQGTTDLDCDSNGAVTVNYATGSSSIYAELLRASEGGFGFHYNRSAGTGSGDWYTYMPLNTNSWTVYGGSSGAIVMEMDSTKLTSINYGLDVAGALRVTDTTKQLELEYDASNQCDFTVSSGGSLTITPSSTFTFITGTLEVTSAITENGVPVSVNTHTHTQIEDGTDSSVVVNDSAATITSTINNIIELQTTTTGTTAFGDLGATGDISTSGGNIEINTNSPKCIINNTTTTETGLEFHRSGTKKAEVFLESISDDLEVYTNSALALAISNSDQSVHVPNVFKFDSYMDCSVNVAKIVTADMAATHNNESGLEIEYGATGSASNYCSLQRVEGTGGFGLKIGRTNGTTRQWYIYIPSGGSNLTFYTAPNRDNNSGGASCLNMSTTSGTGAITSDRRAKKNIKDMCVDACGALSELRPVCFQYKVDSTQTPCAGFIAQEVQKTSLAHLVEVVEEPEDMCTDFVDEVNDGHLHTLKMGELVPYLVKAVQELTKKIRVLEQNQKLG